MANATSTELQELYVAYFGRAADPTGLDYWTNKGITTAAFAADMYAQAEFKDAYGSLSTEAQVNQIYKNLFDREADVTGLTYWTLQVDLGNLKLAEIATHLIWAAKNNSGSSDDKTALENRTNAAVAYTAKVKESTDAILAYQAESTSPWVSGDNIAEAISYLSGIDKDTAHTTAGIAASVTTITSNGVPGDATSVSLTSGVDKGSAFSLGAGNDTFNALLTTTSTTANTLGAYDVLDGGAGTDTINVDVKTAVTPQKLTSIENLNATFSAAVTLGLAQASDTTTVKSLSSTAAATFSGLGSQVANLGVENTSLGTTFTFASTSGTQAKNVSVNNVTGGAAGTIIVEGIETLTFTSSGIASSYEVDSSATTLNFAGAVNQTVVLDATNVSTSLFDASSATGNVTLTTIDQTSVAGTTDVSVTGGAGNDSFTLVESNDLSVSGGAGNDTFTMLAIDTSDTVNGGDGTDTIVTDNANAVALDGATRTTFTNVEAITINDHFDGDIALSQIASSLTTINLTEADAAIIDEAETITGNAGTLTVNIGNSSTDANGDLDGTLTVTDGTASATTDTVNIVNKAKLSTGANVDIFTASDLTSTGYENVNINTGAGTGVDELDLPTLTITPDSTSAAVSLTVTGTNSLHIDTSLTTTSTGLMTVDASGMTAQAAGTSTLTIDSTSHGTSGTGSITGSAGDDVIAIGAFKTTISGGAGNDSLTGGSAIDSIDGGAGKDTIDGGGGNDTLLGGAGNDTFTISGTSVSVDGGAGDDSIDMDATLSAGDTISGGTGTDTLELTAIATGSTSVGVTGFEYLVQSVTGTQDMAQFTNNTFTRVVANIDNTTAFTNVGSSTNELRVISDSTDTTTFSRLVDNSSNTLTIGSYTDANATIANLIIDDEETLNITGGAIDSSDYTFTITNLDAEDLVTINVTGDQNTAITDAIDAQSTAYLTTVDASAATGTVSISAANATKALTMTAAANNATTLTGGSGADTITGGAAADNLTGGGGNDSITGGAAADTLTGGAGADTISGGAGADTINGSAGTDNLTGGAGADDFYIRDINTGADTITDFTTTQTDQLGFSLANVELHTLVTDLVGGADAVSTGTVAASVLSVASNAAVTLSGSAEYLLFTPNYSSAAELQADIRANVTAQNTYDNGDGFLAFYDDGTNAKIALVTQATGASGGALLATAVVTDIATLTGVDDVTDIGTGNILAVVA